MQPSINFLSKHPIRSLTLSFVAWKTLLLLIAAASPGSGYDTSASLTAALNGPTRGLPTALRYLVEKLTRWDAIYFVKIAQRGNRFEQEWAWWGFPRAIALCTAAIGKLGIPHYDYGLEALVGVVIAHVAHLLSVLVLFVLSISLFPKQPSGFALTAALLHIIAPAGIFLSAPYAESSCALLTFSGVLLFAKSSPSNGKPSARHDLLVLLSGVSFGFATALRSNGILNGLLLLEEAVRVLMSLRYGIQITAIRRLLATGLGGISVGAGFLLPQYIAWKEYCGHSDISGHSLRPWCQKSFPSIYSFVQDHYWNVGLFRYWTLSNSPLFLLATPVTFVMILSGLWALKYKTNEAVRSSKLQHARKERAAEPERFPSVRNLAVSQLLLTLLTVTTAHVQIITRISSAYPVCLWYLAARLQEGCSLARNIVRFMVMYAVVQGGLYASFLPPA